MINSQRAAPSCLPNVSHAKCKWRQKDENKMRVEWIEYGGHHLHLQELDPFRDASSYFVIIMRWPILLIVCSVLLHFRGAFVDRVEYRELFAAIALRFWRPSTNESVSVPESQTVRFRTRQLCPDCSSSSDYDSERATFFHFENLDDNECKLTSLLLCWLWWRFERFDDFPKRRSRSPDSEPLSRESLSSLNVGTVSIGSFDTQWHCTSSLPLL